MNLPSVTKADGTTDFYQWGLNCKTMGLSVNKARNIFYDWGTEFTSNQFDEFCYGYFNSAL